ncbi:hypothetical protein [Pedobacter changchengzhani]|uniref:hypothetical protein n=1 Tax=Pedobacter changchengzhani TaxID=2529274 RepID=UPI001404D861|nr:hypothetical protein [Pedobacter changchengzhani]
MKIINFLKQPYPFPFQNWKTLAIIGIAIGACMLLLQPFGLSQLQLDDNKQ